MIESNRANTFLRV